MLTRMSQQSVHGDQNVQVIVGFSENVAICIGGYQVIDLESRRYPVPLHNHWKEIDLLKAAHAQIPFLGRNHLLQEFLQWCKGAPGVSFRTLVGPGGAGKSRFAYELYTRIKQLPDWSAYFLHFRQNSAKGVDLWREIRAKNALLIADYASDSATPLSHVLQTLSGSDKNDRKIRVLLLARTANWEQGWLAGLTSGRTGEDVRPDFHPYEPIPLPSLTTDQRYAIFQRMVETVGTRTGKPIPTLPSLKAFAREDVAERLADPLTLMMAALIAFESGAASALNLNRTELAHEVAWKLVADRMKVAVDHHRQLFLHIAAYATLVGGLSENEALTVLDEESKETKLGPVPDPQAFLEKLQGWLPGDKSKMWIGTIEPDIVGEAFVLGQGEGSYLRDAEQAILRAARRHAGSTTSTVIRMTQDFSFSARDSRLEPLKWLTRLAECGEADGDLNLLAEISDALPESSVVLREIGVRICSALCLRLRVLLDKVDDGDRSAVLARLAASLNNLAITQSEVGQRAQALATAQEATDLYRELVRLDRDAYLPNLAMSLNNLANIQSEVGHRARALDTAQEAADLYRELGDAFLAYLAKSLNNLSNRQSELGKQSAALATALEAVELRRNLVGRNRDEFLPGLAKSLNNLANMQGAVRQWDQALATAQEATDLYRELVARNRDGFLPDLAASLNTLSNRQSEVCRLGQMRAALATALEATELLRELVKRNRDAFLADLATSLSNLSCRQREVSQLSHQEANVTQRGGAVSTAEEAIELLRELADRNRDAFLPDLARSLTILADAQIEAEQWGAALTTVQEVTLLYRELANRNRDDFLPYLAASLDSLVKRQYKTGKWDSALATVRNAVELSNELVPRRRSAYILGLSQTCWKLGLLLHSVGLSAKGLIAYAEAIRMLLPEAAKHSSVFMRVISVLLHEYLQKATETKVDIDTALVEEARDVLKPVGKLEGEWTP